MPVNIKLFTLLFLFFGVVYFGFIHLYNSSQNDTELPETSKNVRDVQVKDPSLLQASSRPKVVLVYAAWCGHCKQMMPEFIRAAEEYSEVDWIRVGDDAAKEIATRQDMKGFPTVYGVSVDGQVRQFGGGRNANQLINFAKTL